ncbi:MAG: FHA domain-containing protein, partial [Bacteroidetes bacterium]|nr:FHA domain-containing protein [Bacteroidota bacterium]
MLYLVAQGPAPRQRWRHQLVPGSQYLLGRDVNCEFPIPWEPAISLRHATVSVQEEGVMIRQLGTARNPIYFQGHSTPEFILHPDQHCVIGTTTLLLQQVQDESPSPVDAPFQEFQFSEPELRQVRFDDADRRMDVLAKIPGVISEVRSRREMAAPLLALLLAGIRQAEAAAIVTRDRQGHIGTLRWDRRSETDGAVRPSTRLIKEAFLQRRSILHVWQGEQQSPARSDYTASAEFDWAYCTPVRSSREEAWGMYVAGRMDGLWVNP